MSDDRSVIELSASLDQLRLDRGLPRNEDELRILARSACEDTYSFIQYTAALRRLLAQEPSLTATTTIELHRACFTETHLLYAATAGQNGHQLSVGLRIVWPDIHRFAIKLITMFLSASEERDYTLVDLLTCLLRFLLTWGNRNIQQSISFAPDTLLDVNDTGLAFRLWAKAAARPDLHLPRKHSIFDLADRVVNAYIERGLSPITFSIMNNLPKDLIAKSFRAGVEERDDESLCDTWPFLTFWGVTSAVDSPHVGVYLANRSAHWASVILRRALRLFARLRRGTQGPVVGRSLALARNIMEAINCLPVAGLHPYGSEWVVQCLKGDVLDSLVLYYELVKPLGLEGDGPELADLTISLVLQAIVSHCCLPEHFMLVSRGLKRLENRLEPILETVTSVSSPLLALKILVREMENHRKSRRIAGEPVYVCSASGCIATNAKKLCSRCQRVVYCSPKCQKSHWTSHKEECNDTAQHSARGEPALLKPHHWEYRYLRRLALNDLVVNHSTVQRDCAERGTDYKNMVYSRDYSSYLGQLEMEGVSGEGMTVIVKVPRFEDRESAQAGVYALIKFRVPFTTFSRASEQWNRIQSEL